MEVRIKQQEFLYISNFRSYCDGYESRIKLQDVFISNLGVEEGYATLDALDSFCELIYKKGRRQLIRHDVSCECIGADENCLCQLVFSACEDNLDDAKLIGTLILTLFKNIKVQSSKLNAINSIDVDLSLIQI